MKMIHIYIITFAVGILGIHGVDAQTKSIIKSLDDSLIEGCWVDKNYFDCIQSQLPCECLSLSAYPVVKIDSTNFRIIEAHNDVVNKDYEYRDGNISFLNSNYLFNGGYLENNDVLHMYLEAGGEKDYIRYNVPRLANDSPLGWINMQMFKKRIEPITIDSSNTALNGKESTMNCIYSLDLNLISIIGKCENKLIVEESDTTLSIFSLDNSCAPKQYPVVIEKTLLFKIHIHKEYGN